MIVTTGLPTRAVRRRAKYGGWAPGRGVGRRPHQRRRQHRRRPRGILLLADVLDHADAGADHRRSSSRPTAATSGCSGPPTPSPAYHARRDPPAQPSGRGQRRRHYASLPDLAGLPAPRAAAAARARPPGGPPSTARDGVEVRVRSAARDAAASVHLPPQPGRVRERRHRRDGPWCGWPTCPARSPPTPSTGWRTPSARRSWPRSSTSTAAGATRCELTDVDPADVTIGDAGRDDLPPPVHRRTASTTTSGRPAPSGRRMRPARPVDKEA